MNRTNSIKKLIAVAGEYEKLRQKIGKGRRFEEVIATIPRDIWLNMTPKEKIRAVFGDNGETMIN